MASRRSSGGFGATFRVLNAKAANLAAATNVRNAARAVCADARADTPVGKTGDLQRGWRVTPAKNYDYRVVNPVPYAKVVEFGTKRQAPAAMLGKALARARARQR